MKDSDWKILVCVAMATLALSLNYYKFQLMVPEKLLEPSDPSGPLRTSAPYKIFPWQGENGQQGQDSKSSRKWLYAHLSVALLLLIESLIWWLYSTENFRLDDYYSTLHLTLHVAFCASVLMNIFNFGEQSASVALLANGIPLLLMNLSWGNWYFVKMLYGLIFTESGKNGKSHSRKGKVWGHLLYDSEPLHIPFLSGKNPVISGNLIYILSLSTPVFFEFVYRIYWSFSH